MLLQIEHRTAYHYSEPVQLGPHRLMLRPLEGHDVQLRSAILEITPAYQIRWVHDIFDNSVAIIDIQEPTAELQIISRLQVAQFNTNPFDFIIEPYAGQLPFDYKEEERMDIHAYLHRHYQQDEEAIRQWIRPFLKPGGKSATLDFLTALNRSVPLFFSYTRREEPGVQSPSETLSQRSGSCRDFALLFMETARYLGLAARFVSGYLCQRGDALSEAAGGATHAWAEIFLPGAGWKGFDPTCGILAAHLHVRTAVARLPSQAPPVAGSFVGHPNAFLGMEVVVNATVEDDSPNP